MPRRVLLVCLLALLVSLSPALAAPPATETRQTLDDSPVPVRDAVDLATRFGGLDPATIRIEPRPAYQMGDVETFNVGGSYTAGVQALPMELAAMTDAVYMWFEQGVAYDPAQVEAIAGILSEQIIPQTRDLFGNEFDLDNDPRIYVLNARTGLAGTYLGLFVDSDRYPDEVIPSSNEINSLIMVIEPRNMNAYLSVFAHEFQHLIQADQDDSEATWTLEGLAELSSALVLPNLFNTGQQNHYLARGLGNQLTSFPQNGDYGLAYGGSSLFLSYITARVGPAWPGILGREPADGLEGITRGLAALDARDPLTDTPLTADDMFADFVAASYLNDPNLADGRYAHTLTNVSGQPSLTVTLTDHYEGQLPPYGTHYIGVNGATDPVRLRFEGQTETALLPAVPHSGDYFYWSQRANQSNARLTGRFDLRGVQNATLRFWTWYDIEAFWDYAYVSLSMNEGESWQTLRAPDMTDEDPHDRAFAPGFTGRSGGNAAAWREEVIDLSAYTGQNVLIRFDYVTDQALSYPGWLLDDFAIPEIGFFDDFERPNDAWQAEGWARIGNEIPQPYLAQWLGPEGTVTRLAIDDAQGTWSLDIPPGQGGVLAISNLARYTDQRAPYRLQILRD